MTARLFGACTVAPCGIRTATGRRQGGRRCRRRRKRAVAWTAAWAGDTNLPTTDGNDSNVRFRGRARVVAGPTIARRSTGSSGSSIAERSGGACPSDTASGRACTAANDAGRAKTCSTGFCIGFVPRSTMMTASTRASLASMKRTSALNAPSPELRRNRPNEPRCHALGRTPRRLWHEASSCDRRTRRVAVRSRDGGPGARFQELRGIDGHHESQASSPEKSDDG